MHGMNSWKDNQLSNSGVCVLSDSSILWSSLISSDSVQLNSHHLPVWASLAGDYLPIMASSVLSERAFSSAGITISKRCSRLKGDIVEALQCLKCMLRHELIFCESGPCSTLKQTLRTRYSLPEMRGVFRGMIFSLLMTKWTAPQLNCRSVQSYKILIIYFKQAGPIYSWSPSLEKPSPAWPAHHYAQMQVKGQDFWAKVDAFFVEMINACGWNLTATCWKEWVMHTHSCCWSS